MVFAMPEKEGSSRWKICLWFRATQAIDFEIAATEQSTDEEIKEKILRGLQDELSRRGLKERL